MRPLSLFLTLMVPLVVGCMKSSTPPVEIQVSPTTILLRSKTSESLKNLRLSGSGFDETVVESLEPNQSCELQLYRGKIRWQPQDGDTMVLRCDGYPQSLPIEIEVISSR